MIKWLSLAALMGVVWLAGCSPPHSIPEDSATYYLVRHAEKTTEAKDPGLTEGGEKRAKDLAKRLEDVTLTKIYTSDYIRTRNTAAPVAASQKVPVTLYDPRQLEAFAKKLLTETGHILVVGHSNTTPQLSEFLGGIAGKPIIEATEYNRFYVISRKDGHVTSFIETYGD